MRALVVALLAVSSGARAEPTLAALAATQDARRAVALGPAGEVYEPDGAGAWIRHRGGEIAGTVAAATSRGSEPIAGVVDGPPFRFSAGAWSAISVGSHAKAVLGAGARPLAAVGRAVFALDRAMPAKLADAPAPVLALAASATGVVIETDRGLARLDGAAWKSIKGAPHHVVALISDRWALGERGAIDLRTATTTAWPAGVHIEVATASGDDLLAATTRGESLELVTLHAGKITTELVALAHPTPIVGIAADREDRVVLALRDGRLALRVHGTWTTTTIRDEPLPARPGSPPALSK